MKVNLAYGQGHLPMEFPDARTTVIEPSHNPALADEKAALLAALDNPIGAKPLRDWLADGFAANGNVWSDLLLDLIASPGFDRVGALE